MTDILIRGMEMPQTCEDCDFSELIQCELWCTKCHDTANHFSRLKDCPLHELPEHGDLIDRDELLCEDVLHYVDTLNSSFGSYVKFTDLVRGAPVIIPATERSEDA